MEREAKRRLQLIVAEDPLKISRIRAQPISNFSKNFMQRIYVLLVLLPIMLLLTAAFAVSTFAFGGFEGKTIEPIFVTTENPGYNFVIAPSKAKVRQEQLVPIDEPVPDYDRQYYERDWGLDLDGSKGGLALHWQRGAQPFAFQGFNFDEQKVPLGDGPHYCLSLRGNGTALEAQELCYGAQSGHGVWDNAYPRDGINFQLWYEVANRLQTHNFEITREDEIEGSSVTKGAQSFGYVVARKACLVVDQMRILGGCFKDREAILYEVATPGVVYGFSDFEVEVRQPPIIDQTAVVKEPVKIDEKEK